MNLELMYKKATEAITLESISLAKVIKFTGATSLRPSESANYGSRIFLEKNGSRCTNDEGEVFGALRVSNKLVLDNEWMTPEALAEIIKKEDKGTIKLYLGETENGPWMAFGKAGEFTPGKAYTIKELTAMTSKVN